MASRIDLDFFVRLVQRSRLASPVGALALALLSYRRERNGRALGCTFFDYLEINKPLRFYLIVVLVKTLSGALSRYASNGGWRADKPRWSSGREIVVITGAGGEKNIGEQIVRRLLKRTNKIAIIDLVPPKYSAGPARFYKCDVGSEEQMREVAERIRRDLGDPTIVISNAGIIRGGKIVNTSAAQFEQVLRVNTLGTFNAYKHFLPAIARANHGHFVTVGSSASYMSIAQNGEYSASKAATLALHETLAQELRFRYNAPRVRTTFVGPTKVRTALGATLKDIDKQFFAPTITAEEVAEQIVRQIDSGLSGHIVQPFYAQLLLPSIRSAPEWFRWLITYSGRTFETVTDESSAAARAAGYTVADA